MSKKSKTKNQKSKLGEEEVRHVAELAGLALSPSEVRKFQKQLSEVLDYIEVLNEIDTEGLEPTSQVAGLENVFREDKVGSSLSFEEVLSGTKNKDRGMFKIKAIFDK